MAVLSKVGTATPGSLLPPANAKYSALQAGEALGAFDACYIKASDGKVYKSTGAAANAAAVVDGFAAAAYVSGEYGVTLWFDIEVPYATGMTAGTNYYVDGTTAGALNSSPSTGGTHPCARTVSPNLLAIRRVWEVG
jgi:hypothetical protein